MSEDTTPNAAFLQFVINGAVRLLRETRDVDSVVRYLHEVAPGTIVQSDLALTDE